jgi:hypothetical protein
VRFLFLFEQMAEHPDFSREGPGFESLQTDQKQKQGNREVPFSF